MSFILYTIFEEKHTELGYRVQVGYFQPNQREVTALSVPLEAGRSTQGAVCPNSFAQRRIALRNCSRRHRACPGLCGPHRLHFIIQFCRIERIERITVDWPLFPRN